MKDDTDIYLTFLVQFAVVSLVAVGGTDTAVSEIHRQAVDLHHWISDPKFSELFAIAQAAPGPNVIFVKLIGHYVASMPGALITTIALCGPTCTIAYSVSKVFDHIKDAT